MGNVRSAKVDARPFSVSIKCFVSILEVIFTWTGEGRFHLVLQIPRGNVHNFQGYPLGKNQEGMPASMTGKIARSPELSIGCRLSRADAAVLLANAEPALPFERGTWHRPPRKG